MEDWPGQFYVAKVSRTFGHALSAGLAFKVSVDGAHAWIHQATELRFVGGLVHDLWVLNLGYRIGFLQDRRMFNNQGEETVWEMARTISSGERMPNWTSLTLRIGAAEYANWWPSMTRSDRVRN